MTSCLCGNRWWSYTQGGYPGFLDTRWFSSVSPSLPRPGRSFPWQSHQEKTASLSCHTTCRLACTCCQPPSCHLPFTQNALSLFIPFPQLTVKLPSELHTPIGLPSPPPCLFSLPLHSHHFGQRLPLTSRWPHGQTQVHCCLSFWASRWLFPQAPHWLLPVFSPTSLTPSHIPFLWDPTCLLNGFGLLSLPPLGSGTPIMLIMPLFLPLAKSSPLDPEVEPGPTEPRTSPSLLSSSSPLQGGDLQPPASLCRHPYADKGHPPWSLPPHSHTRPPICPPQSVSAQFSPLLLPCPPPPAMSRVLPFWTYTCILPHPDLSSCSWTVTPSSLFFVLLA